MDYNEFMDIMSLIPGAVTPLGLLNDNTATVWLKVEDLMDIIKKHGNQVNIIKIL